MRFRSLACVAALSLSCGSAPSATSVDASTSARDAASEVNTAADAVAALDAAPYRCARTTRTPAPTALTTCNGDALCDRRFNEVAYATTHNAMSNADARWVSPNQNHGITRQLRDGIRALMLDAHRWMDDSYLCHGVCLLGHQPLAEGLCEITRFLDENPAEVVSIIFESYISAADTARAFEASGLIEYVHAQPLGAPWPTLGELVRSNRRMVVFTDREGGALPWYHAVFRYAYETRYAFERPEDMDCAPNRGDRTSPLFIFNHFLTAPLASPALAEQVNHNPFLLDRARRCMRERSQLPNFVTVDFYDLGDVLSVVSTLNQAPR